MCNVGVMLFYWCGNYYSYSKFLALRLGSMVGNFVPPSPYKINRKFFSICKPLNSALFRLIPSLLFSKIQKSTMVIGRNCLNCAIGKGRRNYITTLKFAPEPYKQDCQPIHSRLWCAPKLLDIIWYPHRKYVLPSLI